ncbi:penicillin-binding protein 1B [Salinimonas sp. HHU 13199]|uniref:Penicillin-binding protein 1B n=1 Tax=Salinimonas profundi TaxID=2729140 RepID=A0ABR8LKY5_9ALTE|nr:penicillin-binding protein 1B [Salinimonas profundi]MBD3586862.1 penicillin-binding protein 1B [Salinimonas profundi]
MAKKQTKAKKNRKGFYGFFFKLILVAFIVVAGYTIYLDAQIKHTFTGNKWEVPAQIFARPLILNERLEITPQEVLDELELLGYRKVSRPEGSGEYAYWNRKLIVMRRAFQFANGPEPLRRITVTWDGNRIASITDDSAGRQINSIRLEPWLVTRLVSSSREDRMLVTLDSVPDMLPKTLTLVEDRDFYDHHGVAPLSILRALIANLKAGRTVQGGSTLTQQLVKNLYLTREKSIIRKAKEAMMAIIIDARYSKTEILQAYMNEVFLAQDGDMAVHGFGLASYYFFDRPATELNVPEIATLVAMIKGPSYYNPRRYPERVTERRNLILRLLFEANEITAKQYEQYLNAPLDLASGASLASGKHPAYMQRVRSELKDILADPSLRDSGVKVFTTLDIYAQRRAEKALTSTLASLQKNRKAELEGAMVVSDIKTGGIRAIVGSKDAGYSGFNRALDAKRQIGSLVKPAVYLTALEDPTEYNLATPLDDKPITLKSTDGELWSPRNYDKEFRDHVPLITGLVESLNVPTVNLGMALGLDKVANTVKRLGVETRIKEVPAMTLGALSMTPAQTNQMYQTISNNGRYVPLHTVTAVMSAKNNLLWKHADFYSQRADEAATYLLNYGLFKVTREGTAKRLGTVFPNINMAGKTGTTDDYRDAWFSGFDRNNVSTVWVGNDDNQTINLTGASGALPVFINYQRLQSPKSLSRRFPDGLGIAHFNATTGAVTVPGCPYSLSVPAILEVLPPPRNDCAGKPVESDTEDDEDKSWWERWF